MARMNAEYGSELHLLRMLGRHRDWFNACIVRATKADAVSWLDFPSGEMRQDKEGHTLWDREWQHLNFLPSSDPARVAWAAAWPTGRPGHSWDAIGRLSTGEWLLVEAKANVAEMKSSCSAADPQSRALIGRTLAQTKAALGVVESCDWLSPYYQFCNRLAALHVMNSSGTAARLLYVYFCGDISGGARSCPASEKDWEQALAEQDQHVGLQPGHPLATRVHKLFTNVQRVP